MRLCLQLFKFQTETAEYMGAAHQNTDTFRLDASIEGSMPAIPKPCAAAPRCGTFPNTVHFFFQFIYIILSNDYYVVRKKSY